MVTVRIYRASVIIRESLPVLLAMLVFALFTGGTLESSVGLLTGKLIFLLVVIPAFINMEGVLAAVFSSRITSHLYVGTLNRKFRPLTLFFRDLGAIMATATSGFLILSALAIPLNELLFSTPIDGSLILVTFLSAGIISTLAMCAVGAIVAYVTFTRGLNPDNFTAPVTTSVGDALGVFLLILLSRALLLA